MIRKRPFSSRQPESPRRRRRRRLLLGLTGTLLLAIAVLPTILAQTSLVSRLLTRSLKPSGLQLSAANVSLGWFSSLRLGEVEARDQEGRPFLRATSVSLDRSLLELLLDQQDLGTLRVEKPRLDLQIRQHGSNLEDVVQAWLASPEQSATPISLRIEVVAGSIHATDVWQKTSWELQQLEFSCGLTPDQGRTQLTELAARGRIATVDDESGTLQLALNSRADGSGQLEIRAQRVPLVPCSPWLRRVLQGARLRGHLDCDGAIVFDDQGMKTSGSAEIESLQLEADALAGDRLQLAYLRVPWRSQTVGRQIRIERFELTCPLGQCTLVGSFGSATSSGAPPAELGLAALQELEGSLDGSVDLAQLAAALPQTLALRKDTRVTSGTAAIALRARREGQATRFRGELLTENLTGTHDTRQLSWQQPIHMQLLAAHEDGWKLDQFRCDSEFLQVDLRGQENQFAGSLRGDLARLQTQLEQLVDLPGWQLGGRIELDFDLQDAGPGAYQATAEGRVEQLLLAMPGRQTWSEPAIELRAMATGASQQGRPHSLDAANLRLAAGDEVLQLDLAEPMILRQPEGNWSTGVWGLHARGRVEQWQRRFATLLEVGPYETSGTAEIAAQLRVGPQAVRATNLQLISEQLRMTGPGIDASEPRLVLTAKTALLESGPGRLQVEGVHLSSSALTLQSEQLICETGGPSLSGEVAFQVAVHRLDAWRAGEGIRPPAWRFAGEVGGRLKLGASASKLQTQLQATASDLALWQYIAAENGQQAGYRPVWQERRAELQLAVDYAAADDLLQLHEARLTAGTLGASFAGQVQQLKSTRQLMLRGTIDYDLAEWTPVMQAYLGPGAQLSGRQQATLELAGPLQPPRPHAEALSAAGSKAAKASVIAVANRTQPAAGVAAHWSTRLEGRAQAGWGKVNLYGLPLAAGQATFHLREGAATLDPLQVAVGGQGGQVAAAARLLLAPPQQLLLPQGRIVQQVQITPEVSDAVLKYAAPVLAQVTQSQGTFSVHLAGGSVPVSDPKSAQFSGQLIVHSARVQPGPLAQQWLLLAQQIVAIVKQRPPVQTSATQDWIVMNDRTIQFRVVGGRVYHEGLEFQAGEVRIRSQGSVGLDETLDVWLEIPILEAWVGREPWLRGLAGQTVRIAVGGTFAKPRINRGALEELSRQMLRGAASGAIEQGLNRALEELLRPRE